MRKLPERWASAALSDVTQVIMGQSPPSSAYNDVGTGLPFLQGKAEFGALRPEPVKWCTDAKKVAEADDILLSVRAPVGPTNLSLARCCIGRGLAALRPLRGLENRFLLYQIRAREHELVRLGHGVTFRAIRKKELTSWPTFVAPLREQNRIVAKIESLFARLDEGVAALRRAETNLERYRASVLKAAVEGRFTERWRRENPPEETGEELLQRILAERRKRWENEQLAKFAAKGKKPPKNWTSRYKEPVPPDTSGLPGLPEGWCWASLEAVCAVQLGKMLSRSAREGGENRRPYLRNSNVRWFSIDQSDLKSMSFKESELGRYAVRPGDLLVCEGGEPGRCSVYEGPGDFLMYQKALHRARPYSPRVSTEFLQYCLAHQVAHGIGMPRYSETTIRHLTLEKIKAVPLPVAPAIEQRRIARLAANQLASIDDARETITMSLDNAVALRQSVLKRAFEGRLVPQDPNDEPASVLLESIRAKREAEVKKRTRRRAKPKPPRKSQVA